MEIINGSTFGEDDLAEIINGETVIRNSPFCSHQRVVGDLMSLIGQHVNKNKLGQLYTYLDVILEEGINRLQPDLLFIRKGNKAIVQDWIRGVPDMVCEIVSKGYHAKDTVTKKKVYEKFKLA
ncbi:MAG: Uma2 family endonuclease, partial [Candidatus Riflebacteria bacterium]|nr:Uma2 family endonuclease [Candidatus Riflebacteria bacterium]